MSYRLGVLGNCQARGFARSLQAFLPDCNVEVVHMSKAASSSADDRNIFASKLAECDVVFTQPVSDAALGPLTTDSLKDSCRFVVTYPYLAFSGLHPDCNYIVHNGSHLRGPMGPYHSALIAACYQEGLSEERALRLFNAFSFSSLGYYSQFDFSCKSLSRDAISLVYDFSAFLNRSEKSQFMHTINHPAIAIIHDTAAQALAKAGIVPTELEAPLPEDELAESFIWPVYPEIAQRIGCHGSYRFHAHPAKVLDLRKFIFHAFKAYREIESPFAPPPAVERARAFLQREIVG